MLLGLYYASSDRTALPRVHKNTMLAQGQLSLATMPLPVSRAHALHVTLPSTTWDSARHTPASVYLLSTLHTFNVVSSTTLKRVNVGAVVIWDPCWTSSQHKSSYHDQHHLSRASRLGCVYIKLGQSKLFACVCASVPFICGASTWGPNY